MRVKGESLKVLSKNELKGRAMLGKALSTKGKERLKRKKGQQGTGLKSGEDTRGEKR